eukprot:jgi/Phyca11/130611/e_gw1.96.6.1
MTRTPLHIAISDEQLEMVDYLLQCGANAEFLDRWGRSPIDCALETKNVAILRLLERENYVNATDELGRTSLHVAVENGQLGVIELLLSAGVNTNVVKSSEDEQNIALAFRATKQGDMEKLKQLVPELVRPDMEDYDLRTLLHVASAEGHLQIAKYLVDCGANVNLLDRWGSSPLSDAVDFAHNELAKFLIANHA